jgi:hypothetical protein
MELMTCERYKENIMQKFVFSLLAIFILSQTAFGLVDYSAEENIVPNRPKRAKLVKRPKVGNKSVARSSAGGQSYVPTGMFDVTFGYSTVDFEYNEVDVKVNIMEFKGHFETGANIYFDVKYWMADSNSAGLSTSSESQNGNAEVIMGFNWLVFGNAGNMTNIDLLTGVRFKASDSELGATRTDKIVGISTVKRFNQFALGLGYKFYLTGTPDNDTELNIGNMSKLNATFGWMVSNDIQFELEGAVFKINKSDSVVKANVLEQADSIGTITPKLTLRLSSLVHIDLAATFINKKAKNKDQLVGANLWDVPGVYGSSIHAAIAISI